MADDKEDPTHYDDDGNLLCPRCKRIVTGWPVGRPDSCSPKHWQHCIRERSAVQRDWRNRARQLKRQQVQEAAPVNKKITIMANDPDKTLESLLNHIKKVGNVGHSFRIMVDPDAHGRELSDGTTYDGKFDWDGDGADYIGDIKVEKINEARALLDALKPIK